MKVIALSIAAASAFAALATALIATRYWRKASRLVIPKPEDTVRMNPPEFALMATRASLHNSSQLNAKVAFWTGIAAVLAAISAIVALVPNFL